MLKNLTFRSMTALFVAIFCFNSAFSQGFYKETFSDAAAFAKWTTANTGAGSVVWTRETDAAFAMGFNPAAAAFAAPSVADGFAFYNSDLNGEAMVHDATLTSGPIDCASHTSVGLRFHSQFAHFQGSMPEVRVSTDGGTTWTGYAIFADQPASYGFAQGNLVPTDILTELPIPAANGKVQVWIQFRWVGDWEYGWKLDDVELYDYVTPKHKVKFQVNMALQTIDPAGAKIAGSFNGWTDSDMTNAGNGVWTYETDLSEGSEVTWKYKNGPGGWETVTLACGKDDGSGNINRFKTVGTADETLSALCWGTCAPCVLGCAQNPDAIICDNFDTYVTTKLLGAQTPKPPHWSTWSSTANGVSIAGEDGIVSTEQFASAPNSMKVFSTTGTGPQDVVLELGNKTTGRYSLKWKWYVPVDKDGYYNFQNLTPIGAGDWNLEIFYDKGGKGRTVAATLVPFTFTFEHGKWLNIEHVIDLDNNLFKMYIDGKFVGAMPWAKNLGGIDFFGGTTTSLMYLDDLEYVSLPSVTFNVDICDAAVDLTGIFGGAPGVGINSSLQNNTTATVSATDPASATLCFTDLADGQNEVAKVDGSMWYTFPGDGKRYHIETVKCTATNYINYGPNANQQGDTQMSIYSGNDCSSLTQVICNEDVNFAGGNFAAGLDIETVAGTNYYMMIDGFNLGGTVAKGEYCVQVTLAPSILCDAGKVGGVTGEEYLCFGDATSLTLNAAGTIIPTIGPISGVTWAISTAPIPAGTWPPSLGGAGGIVTVTYNTINSVWAPSPANDASATWYQPGQQLYFTPVVVAGATLIDPAVNSFMSNLDVTNGCFYVGTSSPVFLMHDASTFPPISGTIAQSSGPGGTTLNLTPNGGPASEYADPSFFVFQWSNGATTEDITVPAGGSYSVTISDISGCSGILPAIVQITGAQDPASVKSLVVSPNPTTGEFNFTLNLETPAEVRFEIVNTIGQVVRTMDFGKTANVNQSVNLENVADGTYFLHINIDGQKTYRSIVIAH